MAVYVIYDRWRGGDAAPVESVTCELTELRAQLMAYASKHRIPEFRVEARNQAKLSEIWRL